MKQYFSAASVPAGRAQRLYPPILGGASHQAEYPTPPYTTLPNEA